MVRFIILVVAVLLSCTSKAQQLKSRKKQLLNAYHAPLSALTAPHQYYFLEFPLSNEDSIFEDSSTDIGPRCNNGEPYSFLFRRGSNLHANKLLVEFEGESATASLSTPWYKFQSGQVTNIDGTFIPPLGTCTGLSQGFISIGAEVIGFGNEQVSLVNTTIDGTVKDDIDTPIFLRPQYVKKLSWWQHLSGDYSSIHDWSYLFIPHCTQDSMNTTSVNIESVSNWISTQFASNDTRSLDALVVVSGGSKIGGCSSINVTSPSAASYSLSFAMDTTKQTSSDALVLLDGASVRNDDTVESTVQQALSSKSVDIAWIAAKKEDDNFVQTMGETYPKSFHVHRTNTVNDDGVECPLYAFSDRSADEELSNFLDTVVTNMPWAKQEVMNVEEEGEEYVDDDSRLSFLAIMLIVFGIYLTAWIVYLLIKLYRQRQAKKKGDQAPTLPPSPHDIWFLALTKAPTLFLIISIAIPVILSYVAYKQNGNTVSVNLDFESYLDIDTREERISMQYKTLLENQKESLKVEEANCQLLYEGIEKESSHTNSRDLQEYTKRNGRPIINFFYQNRKGGDVFTPSVLMAIRQFELDIRNMPQFDEVCYSNEEGQCLPFDSIVSYFFDTNGNLVEDIDSVLRSFSTSTKALAKMDRYFSKSNLGSNVTMTTMWLDSSRDRDDIDQNNINEFLETLHRQLWEDDSTQKYPEIIISWRNAYMTELEASDAIEYDFKWSLAALCFIAVMVFIKVFNVVTVLFSVLGLILSFTTALYWQNHFDFSEMTALHVAGLFVMLGIGADDIFLFVDSFEHTKVEYINAQDDNKELETQLHHPDIVKKRLISSYKTAGMLMLISSVTTAICFFSNVLSSVISVRDFGSYMGTVVLLNYVHVMTILPSGMLANELYIKPLQRKLWAAICSKKHNGQDLVESNTILADDRCPDEDVIPPRSESSIQEDDDFIENGNIAVETATVVSLSQERETTPATTMSSDEVKDGQLLSDEEDDQKEQESDYCFLKHTNDMNSLDRVLVSGFAPCVYKLRHQVIAVSIAVTIIFAALGFLNFQLYDGTIIVFKEQYNLGRMQRLVDTYYPEDLVKMYLDQGVEVFGSTDISVEDLESIGSVGAEFISSSSSATSPSPPSSSNFPPPIAKPSQPPSSSPMSTNEGDNESPSSSPEALPSSPLSSPQNGGGTNDVNVVSTVVEVTPITPSTSTISNTPPSNTDVVSSPTTSVSSPATSTTADEVWYPNWTGDNRGCLNDGNMPQLMLDNQDFFIFDTLAECCEKNFAWDPNPTNCLGIDTTNQQESPKSVAPITSNPTTSPIRSSVFTTSSPTTTSSTTNNQDGSSPPTVSPSSQSPINMPTERQFTCPEGITNTKYCIQTNGVGNTFQKREYFVVSLVWGMKQRENSQSLWTIRNSYDAQEDNTNILNTNIHPADLQRQLLQIVTQARLGTVGIHPQLTWIEAVEDFAIHTGIGFPLPRGMFIDVVENLKARSSFFRKLVEREIATSSPGIVGDEYFYTSVSMLSEVPLTSKGDASEEALNYWTNFAKSINDDESMVIENMPPVLAQSDAFLDSLRTTAIVDSTISSYFFANGLFLIVILLFTGNLLLTLMVMISLVFILLCLAGVIFAVFKIE